MAMGKKSTTVKKSNGSGYKQKQKTIRNLKTGTTKTKYKVKNKVTGGKEKEVSYKEKGGATVSKTKIGRVKPTSYGPNKTVTTPKKSKSTKSYSVTGVYGRNSKISKNTYRKFKKGI